MPDSPVRLALEFLAPHVPGEGRLLTLRILDDRSLITFVAGDSQALTGFDPLTFQKTSGSWERLVHEDDRDAMAEALASARGDEALTLEYRIVTRDGDVRTIQEDITVLPGLPIEAFGVVRDVSVDRRVREHLSGLEERLWRSQRMEALGTLAGGIAHDFNNVLTMILAAVQLVAEEDGLSEASRVDLEMVRGAAGRGAALVKQILEFAARDEGRPARVADLSAVALGVEPLLTRTMGEDIRLTVRVSEGVWPANCDAAAAEQVILNLTVNAREAMARGGDIVVEVSNLNASTPVAVEGGALPPGRFVHLLVADTGHGISSTVRERLFDQYFTTKPGAGAGFGLATVRRIVGEYGGGIAVETPEGGGTVFHVYFAARETTAASVGPYPHTESPSSRTRLRVLVVEDDALVREILTRSLVRDGHDVTGAASVKDGLAAFHDADSRFHLLITDVVLPDRTGADLYREVAERRPGLPVIYMSGYGEDALRKVGDLPQNGVFLQKPIEPRALRDAVVRVMSLEADRGSSEKSTEAHA